VSKWQFQTVGSSIADQSVPITITVTAGIIAIYVTQFEHHGPGTLFALTQMTLA